jgi:hypothetical protein
MLQTTAPIPEDRIRQVVDSVFRAGDYNRATLWARFVDWLHELWLRILALLDPLRQRMHASPVLYWTLLSLLAVALLAIIARWLYLWRARSRRGAAGLGWELASFRRNGRDPWSRAQELAAAGEFTDAAHALYGALLEAAARQQQLRLHPSKTVGDYVRELRGASSSLFARFREFARSYETVIYGIGFCDRERFERLRALAIPIVRPNG